MMMMMMMMMTPKFAIAALRGQFKTEMLGN